MDQPSRRAPSGVVAFLLTDIEGSTRLWQQHPQEMRALIQRHDAILTEAIQANGGEVLTERGEGDSFFAVFGRASEALAAARDAQRALQAEAWPPDAPIRVRMAINTGEAAGDFRGMAANRSGRLRQLAAGGEILVSQSTQVLVRDELPAGVALVDRGMRRLRDVESPEHVYEASVDGLRRRREELPEASRRRVSFRRYLAPLGAAATVVIIGTLALAIYLPGRGGREPGSGRNPAPAARSLPLQDRKILTVVGGGTGSATGSDLGTDVALDGPTGIAAGPDGAIYVSDTGHNLVLRLAGGRISIVAGGGNDVAPSGQLATELRLNRPTSLFVDMGGNLYVADTGNNRVLEVNPRGFVSALAGSGRRGTPAAGDVAAEASLDAPTGIVVSSPGYDSTTGNQIFIPIILDSGTRSLWVVFDGKLDHLDYGFGIPNTNLEPFPQLATGPPGALCAGVDTVYAIDSGGSRILNSYAVMARFRQLSTGSVELRQPQGCAVDARDRLFIADTGDNVVRLYDAATGGTSTIAGDGTVGLAGDGGRAARAELNGPAAIAVDSRGDVFIADTGNNRVREILAS